MDIYDSAKRSDIMSGVRSEDTEPELAVQRVLEGLGYPFATHSRDLPGTPDIVLPRRQIAIFVHGCFWHHHDGCPKSRLPQTNRDVWQAKIMANVERDERNFQRLDEMGWSVIVIWECQIGEDLPDRIRAMIEDTASG